MPEITWTNVVVTLGELVPWDHNPKGITEGNARRLLEFWKQIGQFQTIAIGPNNEVYDGHQRLEDTPNAFIDAGDCARFAFYDEQESDVWEVRKSAVNDLHPTMKPTEIVRRAINNSSSQGETVADWFCGSGTTLVTCEQEGRLGRGMEIDPKYAAVTLQRLSDMEMEPVLVSG